MTLATAPTNPARRKKAGVQNAYTEAQVYRAISDQIRAGMSLREIAKTYSQVINHADIERITQGKFPKSADKRRALNVVELAPAPVCPIHGVVHTRSTCPSERVKKQPVSHTCGNCADWEEWVSDTQKHICVSVKANENLDHCLISCATFGCRFWRRKEGL